MSSFVRAAASVARLSVAARVALATVEQPPIVSKECNDRVTFEVLFASHATSRGWAGRWKNHIRGADRAGDIKDDFGYPTREERTYTPGAAPRLRDLSGFSERMNLMLRSWQGSVPSRSFVALATVAVKVDRLTVEAHQ